MFIVFENFFFVLKNKKNNRNKENMFGAYLFTIFEICFMFTKTRKSEKTCLIFFFFFGYEKHKNTLNLKDNKSFQRTQLAFVCPLFLKTVLCYKKTRRTT